jgi:hypothetical protein
MWPSRLKEKLLPLIRKLKLQYYLFRLYLFFPEGRQVVWGIGVVDMSDQFAAAAGEIHAPSQQVAGGRSLGRIGKSGRTIAAFEQQGQFVGIDLIVFGFAPVVGFHVQCMTKDDVYFVIGSKIRLPLSFEAPAIKVGQETHSTPTTTSSMKGNTGLKNRSGSVLMLM